MGTSNSYGGSSKKDWVSARQQILDLSSGDGRDSSGDGQDAESGDPLDDLWGTVADALDSDDPTLHAPELDQESVSLPNLMPWLSSTGPSAGRGRGGGAGGGSGSRTGGGRQGRGSRRQVTRSAARGGTVLGAAHAVRRGDAEYLQEIGLDLGRLQSFSPLRQAAEILDAVLGEGSHPDEAALRRASLEALKEVLAANDEPEPIDSLRSFVTNFVFEQSLVELQRQMTEAGLTTEEAAEQERTIKNYLAVRVKRVKMPASGNLHPSDIKNEAVRLTKEVIKLLRSRTGAAK